MIIKSATTNIVVFALRLIIFRRYSSIAPKIENPKIKTINTLITSNMIPVKVLSKITPLVYELGILYRTYRITESTTTISYLCCYIGN